VYAVLGVNSWSCHGEIERDDLTLCSAMMVEMWMRKREMWDEDKNDVEDTSGYERSGVRLAWSGWEDLVSVLLHAGSGLVPAVSGMVNWLAHKILLSPGFSWWFVPSPLPSPKNTKLSHPCLSLPAMIKSQRGSRSIGWGWEDMILPSREDPCNWVDSRNRRKSKWDQTMGMIECVFRIDQQSEKKRRNGDQRVIRNMTHGIHAGRRVIHHWGVSEGSDGARPLSRSHSAQTEMFSVDAQWLVIHRGYCKRCLITDIYIHRVGNIYRQISKRYCRDRLLDNHHFIHFQSCNSVIMSVLAYKTGQNFGYRQ